MRMAGGLGFARLRVRGVGTAIWAALDTWETWKQEQRGKSEEVMIPQVCGAGAPFSWGEVRFAMCSTMINGLSTRRTPPGTK